MAVVLWMTVSSFIMLFIFKKKKNTMRIIFPIAVAVILTMAISSIFVAHYSRERNEIENLVGPVCQNWEPPVTDSGVRCDENVEHGIERRELSCRTSITEFNCCKVDKTCRWKSFCFFQRYSCIFLRQSVLLRTLLFSNSQ